MELIMVRHALPERKELDDGVADPGLTADGHRQAELLAGYLGTERVDAVYTSPLARARETAAPLERELRMTATVVDDVAEFDRNASEYIPIEELKAAGDPRFYDLTSDAWTGNDPFDDFDRRVTVAIDGLIDAHAGHTIVVVCHGGVINLVLARVLGIDQEGPGFFYPNYTSIHRVAASRSGVRSIVTINETAHLRNTGLPMGLFQKG
ncbi:histidine phosphatase family protein [Ilumatobacter sp.]|uniref:histidine phosphatase family protein n=1 Tax=Ilumatobacter sp. TaxID=1967498 RepID=UPI003AF64528